MRILKVIGVSQKMLVSEVFENEMSDKNNECIIGNILAYNEKTSLSECVKYKLDMLISFILLDIIYFGLKAQGGFSISQIVGDIGTIIGAISIALGIMGLSFIPP